MRAGQARRLRNEGTEWQGRVRLPSVDATVEQSGEWCTVEVDGAWRRIRLHDYHEIFALPGLYEHLFYGTLECRSPARVTDLLADVHADYAEQFPELGVLDLGAGNGIVAERLHDLGVRKIVGLDIIEDAKRAAERDRPGLYHAYHVVDMCQPPAAVERQLVAAELNCLTCVAALGFGDIPPRAFVNAFNLIKTPGLLAFNIKEAFLDERYTHGFALLIRRAVQEKLIRVEMLRRYQHRLSLRGEPLYYVAMVATKLHEIPASFVVEGE